MGERRISMIGNSIVNDGTMILKSRSEGITTMFLPIKPDAPTLSPRNRHERRAERARRR